MDDFSDQQAQGAENAGTGGQEDAGNAEGVGQVAGVQGAGAAEGHKGEGTRVEAAFD